MDSLDKFREKKKQNKASNVIFMQNVFDATNVFLLTLPVFAREPIRGVFDI